MEAGGATGVAFEVAIKASTGVGAGGLGIGAGVALNENVGLVGGGAGTVAGFGAGAGAAVACCFFGGGSITSNSGDERDEVDSDRCCGLGCSTRDCHANNEPPFALTCVSTYLFIRLLVCTRLDYLQIGHLFHTLGTFCGATQTCPRFQTRSLLATCRYRGRRRRLFLRWCRIGTNMKSIAFVRIHDRRGHLGRDLGVDLFQNILQGLCGERSFGCTERRSERISKEALGGLTFRLRPWLHFSSQARCHRRSCCWQSRTSVSSW